MQLHTVCNEGGAEVIGYTNSGLGRVGEVRECYSAKLTCMLIINYYYFGSEINYHLGGRISILASASRKFSRIRHYEATKF
jgi:hypothetical protein